MLSGLRAPEGPDDGLEHRDPERERGDGRKYKGDADGHAPFDELPGQIGREGGHLALSEVDDVGRPVDEDQRQREGAVDRPRRHPVENKLNEQCHLILRGRTAGPRDRREGRRPIPEAVISPASMT